MARNDRGQTALFIAGFSRHAPAAQALVASGAQINAVDANGETPLVAAAHGGCLETATAMLRAGAWLHARDNAGVTVLMHAVMRGLRDFAQLLLTHIAQQAVCRLQAPALTGSGLEAADGRPRRCQCAGFRQRYAAFARRPHQGRRVAYGGAVA